MLASDDASERSDSCDKSAGLTVTSLLHWLLRTLLAMLAASLGPQRIFKACNKGVSKCCKEGRADATARDCEASQSINEYVSCPGGQLGPNRQEVQFGEFIQTRFASYMQSIPSGNHQMYAPL